MNASIFSGISGASAAGTTLAVLAPKCPMCLAAYATPAGVAVAVGLAGAVAVYSRLKVKAQGSSCGSHLPLRKDRKRSSRRAAIKS